MVSMSQKKLLILIIIGFVMLTGTGFFLTRGRRAVPPTPTTRTTPTIEPKQLLAGLAEAIGVTPELRDSPYWSWVDEDENIIPLHGTEFFIGTVNINGIGRYGEIPDNDISQVTFEYLQPIMTVSDRFFTQQGFGKNVLNTNTKPDKILGQFWTGYGHGSIKCIAELSTHTDPFGRFFCGTIDENQLTLQKEFRTLFPLKYTPGEKPGLLHIEKVVGDFAVGNYAEGAGPGGYTFMAKKVDGQWTVPWKGQDIASCNDMVQYGIPQEIYGQCWDEKTHTVQPAETPAPPATESATSQSES